MVNQAVAYDPTDGPSLFARWEGGEKTALPAPLATRSRWYRAIIVGLAKRYAALPRSRVISVGAGNGFAEAELMRAGYDVLATDVSVEALRHCAQKGLRTAFLDLQRPARTLGRHGLVYADGVLGHLMIDPSERWQIWKNLALLTATDGVCLVSNDLADDDTTANLRVASDPDALFLRPPAGWYGRDALGTGLWNTVWTRAVRYHRPGRGLRRRELMVIAPAY